MFNILMMIMFSNLLFNMEMMNNKKNIFNFYINFKLNFFFMTIFLIFFFLLFYLKYYMYKEKMYSYFMLLLLLFVLSMIFLILSNNLFTYMISWEMLGISSFLLIFYYKNWKSMNNSLITMFSNRLGDFFFLIVFSIYINNSSMNYMKNLMNMMIYFIIFTKTAQYPLMAWLPAAMAAPTPISALVHSATLVTAGLLLFTKINSMLNLKMSCMMFIIGFSSMFLSSIMCFIEKDFKKIVAFSTLSQISFMMISMSMNFMYLCLFHLYSHAFFKSMLFFSVGKILHNMNNNQDKRMYNNMYIMSNMNINLMMLTLMSMSGMLFLSGFFSKESVLENFFIFENNIFIFLYMFTLSITMMYSFKMFMILFLNSNMKINILESSQMFIFSIFLSFFFSIFLSIWYMNNMLLFSEKFNFKEKIFFIMFFFFYLIEKMNKKMFFIMKMKSLFFFFNFFKKNNMNKIFFYMEWNFFKNLFSSIFFLKNLKMNKNMIESFFVIFFFIFMII